MGRRAIPIEKILDPKKRSSTYRKRMGGLIKKSKELARLCNCHVALVINNSKHMPKNGRAQYASADVNHIKTLYDRIMTETKEESPLSKASPEFAPVKEAADEVKPISFKDLPPLNLL